MSNETKPADLKGMLKNKNGQCVPIEEMNQAIREQGRSAMDGLGSQNIVDLLNDVDGQDIEFEPPKLKNCSKLPER